MRRVLLSLLVVLVALGAAGTLFGSRLLDRLHEPYKGFPGSEQFIEIAPGSTAVDIRRQLARAGVVRDEFLFRVALLWTGQARALKAGEYRFTDPAGPIEVIERLARGDVYAHPITFPEGLTLVEMAATYEASGAGEAASFLAAAQNAALVSDLDPEALDLEGYLFPDTYALPRGTPAAQLVAMMVDLFRRTWEDLEPSRGAGTTLTVREVVTLASLVEKETALAEERTLVSAVYHNRLARGMLMQADPTVVYALVLAGAYDGNIRRADLGLDSPYNTYRYAGLPPGPIAAPGRASLAAALAPADVTHLFFVSRNDGSHAFADTLARHNANVYEHQVLYFRRARAQARSGQ
jgi:UPF0755 protein